MNHDLEPQLRALADKYRERRFQLSKVETGEATTLCTKVLQDGREGFDLCWQFAPYLPAESLADAIASTWTSLDKSLQREVIARQQSLPEAAATRLRLRSAVALRPIDAAAARRLLSSACYTMTNTPKKRPNKEQVKLFRTVLLNGDNPALVDFAFESHTQAEIAPLLSCVLEVFSARSTDPKRSFSTCDPRVIEWLLQNDLFQRLTDDQRTVALALIKSWSREVKAAFALKHEYLSGAFDEALRLDEVLPPSVVETESVPAPSAIMPAMEPKRNVAVRELLDQVGLVVKTIEAENKRTREELQKSEGSLQALRTELREAKSSLQRIEGEQIESRAALHEKNAALQIALTELEELSGKLDASALELTSEKEKSAAETKMLLHRIEVERQRAVEAFENGLADKIRVEWQDFKLSKDLPMDTQVGEVMRTLVRGIFDMLEREGLKIRN